MSYTRRHSTNVCPGNRVRYSEASDTKTAMQAIYFSRDLLIILDSLSLSRRVFYRCFSLDTPSNAPEISR